MSSAQLTLNAGGLVPAKAKVDNKSSEEVVARTYRHPALGDRPVVRISSARLGQAEDLAMEFLGFEAPQVSKPLAIQQRRSLGFAAWALINDPDNAHYALDLVKRMKSADRKAKSKPGHAWDAYDELSKELGRSVRHFLPPFWEEVGRAYKELGNQTYAGRALNRSLEAERVHALESDRGRRRDVILEFVLAGCLAGKALSDYTNDLKSQYPPQEAFEIFQDLCVRRTRGGMAPWANLPKDFLKLAKAADIDADAALEAWLEDIIETPAMGRAALQFWKGCDKHCRRIIKRNPGFAMALIRHTKPEVSYWGESKLWPWLDLLDDWGVLEFLREEGHQGAPPLEEPIAAWFGRILLHELPVPRRVLDMLEHLAPRLKEEGEPLSLYANLGWRSRGADVDVLETCLDLDIPLAAFPPECEVDFNGWLMEEPDHKFRNRDVLLSPNDDRFATAVKRGLNNALTCRGEAKNRGYRVADLNRHPFPVAADGREGILKIWHEHALDVVGQLENTGLASFSKSLDWMQSTFWPETLRYFPDVADRLAAVEPTESLKLTLQSGIIDEYGWPELESLVEQSEIPIKQKRRYNSTCSLVFPQVVLWNKTHAFVLDRKGKITKRELRVPANQDVLSVVPVGDDVAVLVRDTSWNRKFYWLSDPSQAYDADYEFLDTFGMRETVLEDGGLFYGKQAVHPGDSKEPQGSAPYFHDGERFWEMEWAHEGGESRAVLHEIDPQTGKQGRASVPSWFESEDGNKVDFRSSYLYQVPDRAHDSPIGCKGGMVGWKVIEKQDGTFSGVGIDGQSWEKPIRESTGTFQTPIGLLRRIGTDGNLPIIKEDGDWPTLLDPQGETAIASLERNYSPFSRGQVVTLPLTYWHFLTPRHEATSKKLRTISNNDTAHLIEVAEGARAGADVPKADQGPNIPAAAIQVLRGVRPDDEDEAFDAPSSILESVEKLFPKIPERFALGIVGIVQYAEQLRSTFMSTRNRLAEEAENDTGSSEVLNQKIDASAQLWNMPNIHIYGQSASFAQHLTAVSSFLKGEQESGPLPIVNYQWFKLLDDLPLRAWQTYWRAQGARLSGKDDREPAWRDLLSFLATLGFEKLPGRFDLLIAKRKPEKKSAGKTIRNEHSPGTAYSVVDGDNRYVVLECGFYSNAFSHILRYSTAKKPKAPTGFIVESEERITPEIDAPEFEAFFGAIDDSDDIAVPTGDQLKQLADQVGASAAEVGLIWIGGLNFDSYETNFLPTEIRNKLGIKMADAKAARQSLTNLNEDVRNKLFHSVISCGLTAPFADDREQVLNAVKAAWNAYMPKRIPLDAEHQKRLSALTKASRWGRVDHEHVLAAATDPQTHEALQVGKYKIQVDPTANYHSLSLKGKEDVSPVSPTMLQILSKLVALVHSDTEIGHEARKAVPAIIKQMAKVIEDDNLLWELRQSYFYDDKLKPVAWLNQHVGKATVGKDKVARFDDGLILAGAHDEGRSLLISYRVGKVQSMDEVGRLVAVLNIEEDPYGNQSEPLKIIALLRSSGFRKLSEAIAGKSLDPGCWSQNALHSAPDVVAAVAKKMKLSEDAALLYLQTLALPDPTTANIRKWNDWTAARYKKAAAEVTQQGLFLEAKRARAGRSHFLPGEWQELKAPWLPVEAWKLPLLVEMEMDCGTKLPLGGPLVLRPFEDLFKAAWKRVCDGDAPRYEEVGKKVKKPASRKK